MNTSNKRIFVIGAGSTGSSTAYHLAKAGANVTLIDRAIPASGMTSLSTAIIRTHYTNEFVANMALYSRNILRVLPEAESRFVRSGFLMLVTEEMKDAIRGNVKKLNRIGARNEMLDLTEASKKFPWIDFSGSAYCIWEPESGYTDPAAITNHYVTKAEEMGCGLLTGRTVARLERTPGSKKIESILFQDGTRLKCDKVILCTNVWTNKLLSESGATELLPIRVAPHPVGVFIKPHSLRNAGPVVSDRPNKAYYRPEGQSLTLVGSLDPQLDEVDINPEDCPRNVPFETIAQFSKAISGRIPSMQEGEFRSSYFGMYDITPDEHPIIDELSEIGLQDAYCCVGLSGHGFKLCPALGLMNSEMILETKEGEIEFDRLHFALSRFKEGNLIRTTYPRT